VKKIILHLACELQEKTESIKRWNMRIIPEQGSAEESSAAELEEVLTARRVTLKGIIYRLRQLQSRGAYALQAVNDFTRLRVQPKRLEHAISVVVVGRNDDYAPDFGQRLASTIKWNIRHLASEVVFVEWNPSPERELLSINLARQFACLRAYVVPAESHQEICQSPHVPLLEFHAKNVGLRRVESPWVIVTNADAAFGLDSVRRLLRAPLSEDVAWTAQRIDIRWRDGRQRPVNLLDCMRYKRISDYAPLGAGEFHFASRQLWDRIRGYDESLTKHRWACDSRGIAQMLAHGAHVNRAGIVLHLAHPTSCTEQRQLHHGEGAPLNNLPYRNDDNWGMSDYREVEIAERVWRLER
jgi:hypothetical protein